MKPVKNPIPHWIGFRIKEEEYRRIIQLLNKSTCRSLSEYSRKVLLRRPITIKYRNASADDFLTEMVKLKNELNAIGNNFNQAVHKLHTMERVPEVKEWLSVNEPIKEMFLEKNRQIICKLNQIFEQWLQK